MSASCIHHWLIAPGRAATSSGTCKICGETKIFQNVITHVDFRNGRKWTPAELRLINKARKVYRSGTMYEDLNAF